MATGESISDWAERHKFSRANVYDVLSGRPSCRYGECHHIAVALGLKKQGADPAVTAAENQTDRAHA